VLLLGVDHWNNTSLHLAESRANYPGKKTLRSGSAMLVNGQRQ
jgi:aminoglycoside 3-N-acetyltransferase